VPGKFSDFDLAKKGFAALKKNNLRLASGYFARRPVIDKTLLFL